MKKIAVMLMLACLLAAMFALPSAAAEVAGTMRSDAPVSTGPGDQYALIPKVTLASGSAVTVRTKFYSGGETWLQVEFVYAGVMARGYVRADDVSASISRVPAEAPLCTGTLLQEVPYAATGPVYGGYLGWEGSLHQGESAIVYEVEDGSAFVEYWNYDLVKKCRSWVPLGVLKTQWSFSSQGYYGVAEEDSLHVPSPTRAPSTYFGSVQQGYPVGVMCTVVSGSCHIKDAPGAEYRTVGYAYVGERYEVLECRHGTSGKDWYLIRQGNVYGWISSGLVSLD